METPDERVGRLLEIGFEVADRMRDEPADAVARRLVGLDGAELRDLVLLLAAAVDISATPSVLFGWWHGRQAKPKELRPCGTHAAAQRHRNRKEPLCDECREAERARDRIRKRLGRVA